jgi:hypothetical protein
LVFDEEEEKKGKGKGEKRQIGHRNATFEMISFFCV